MSREGKRIGFIGGGAMAEALAGGLIAAGVSAADILAADIASERREGLAGSLGVRTTAENSDVVRGLVAGVLRNVLHALPGECGDYLAWIGPAIGVDAYQVGEEVADGVREMDDAGVRPDRYLSPNNAQTGKYQLDLAGLATQQLFYLGVAEVSCERICSYGDRRFYSHRREGTTGRMATVVWLADAEVPLR